MGTTAVPARWLGPVPPRENDRERVAIDSTMVLKDLVDPERHCRIVRPCPRGSGDSPLLDKGLDGRG